MCRIFSILGAIFALNLSLAQAKHQKLRVFGFASADCNGPPILGNLDIKRDVCATVPFGATSIKILEVNIGEWILGVNRGSTHCYFYGYTQYGCLERYTDMIVDPIDVIDVCIPAKNPSEPIQAVSFTCFHGAPPASRRWAVGAAKQTADVRQLTEGARVKSKWQYGPAPNATDDSDDTKSDANDQAASAGSVTRRGLIWVKEEIDLNVTSNANDTKSDGSFQHAGNQTAKHHRTYFFVGAQRVNSPHKFNSSKSDDQIQYMSARSISYERPAFVNGEPYLNWTRKPSESNPDDYNLLIGNQTTGSREVAYVNGTSNTNRTLDQLQSVGTPTVVASNNDSVDSVDPDDSEDSDDDDDDDADDDGDDDSGDDSDDETDDYGSKGNSTSLKQRKVWSHGPSLGVWMLHPWTGGLLCYDCFSKKDDFRRSFTCHWGHKWRADCGEKPLAAVYTKTVSIQPVVTVAPFPDEKPHPKPLAKRSWHVHVYLQNPWFPSTRMCGDAKWMGRGKKWKQHIRVKTHHKMKQCDKAPHAQNIAVWIRTSTTVMPIQTVSIMDQRDSGYPPEAPAQTTAPEVTTSTVLMYESISSWTSATTSPVPTGTQQGPPSIPNMYQVVNVGYSSPAAGDGASPQPTPEPMFSTLTLHGGPRKFATGFAAANTAVLRPLLPPVAPPMFAPVPEYVAPHFPPPIVPPMFAPLPPNAATRRVSTAFVTYTSPRPQLTPEPTPEPPVPTLSLKHGVGNPRPQVLDVNLNPLLTSSYTLS